MEWLPELYPETRIALTDALPNDWPDFRLLVQDSLDSTSFPEIALPLASCRAVGGTARDAVAVSAALIAAELSVRVLDDALDQDRPHQLWRRVGIAGAANYASALQALSTALIAASPIPPGPVRRLHGLFADTFLRIAAGQHADASGSTRTVDDYWRTAELKTASAFAAACASGAVVGTNEEGHIEACHRFGHHLGMALQILNDLESVWGTDPKTDLHQAKVTLPVVYALSFDHPDRSELLALVSAETPAWPVGRVVEILDRVDTRAFLIWAALQERSEALIALEGLPVEDGKLALESYVTALFGDIDELLEDAAWGASNLGDLPSDRRPRTI